MTLPEHELGNSQRPGQMTAAMRASISARSLRHGPKLLRIGVVQALRVREERTLRAPAQVSVGTSEQNTFLLAGDGDPACFRLFEHLGDGWYLNFTAAMRGRVVLASGLFELEELTARAERIGADVHRVALSDQARGKIVLGDVTFLFHFVEASPLLPKAVLPVAVLRGRAGLDWNSTLYAALSFCLHFVVLCAVYSDWLDPVIDDDASTAGLVDSLKNLPPPPAVEDKAALDEPSPADHEEPRVSQTKPRGAAPIKKSRGDAPPSRVDAAELSNRLAQIDMAILGALGTAKPATGAVLRRSDVALSELDGVAPSAAGVGSNTDLRLPGGASGVIAPGTFQPLRELGTTTRGTGGHGSVASVKAPQVVTNLAQLFTTGGAVSDAARVVAGMRAGFRACYQRGLAEDPDASGSIKLLIRVGPSGEVLGVSASPAGNLPPTVVRCVQARAQAAQFEPPQGGSAVIAVPVSFVKQ